MTKTCSKCLLVKDISLFTKDSTKHDGLHTNCKDCKNESSRLWKSKNKSRISKVGKIRYENNKSRISEVNKKWKKENYQRALEHNKKWISKDENKEKIAKAQKIWWENNPGLRPIYSKTRFIAKNNGIPSWLDETKLISIYVLCAQRTKETGIKHHVDHIVPLIGKIGRIHVVCGLHCDANLQVIPATENLKKNCYYWPDMP
jgi:hypothetical protein